MTLARRPTQYRGVRPINPPNVIYADRAPVSTDVSYVRGDIWEDLTALTAYLYAGGGVWITLGSGAVGGVVTLTGGSGGAISPTAGNINLLGTANQITTVGSGSTITWSIPTTFIAPGTIASTTTITAGSALIATTTVTAGTGITSTTGNIVATAGQVNAGTSMTAGTSITATLGNITATNGNLVLTAAGNKMVRTSVGSGAAAGANSIGTATLIGGTLTISTTALTASSLVRVWRESIGATGAAATGNLTPGTRTAGVSFVINSVSAADATALATTDVSVVGWEIIN